MLAPVLLLLQFAIVVIRATEQLYIVDHVSMLPSIPSLDRLPKAREDPPTDPMSLLDYLFEKPRYTTQISSYSQELPMLAASSKASKSANAPPTETLASMPLPPPQLGSPVVGPLLPKPVPPASGLLAPFSSLATSITNQLNIKQLISRFGLVSMRPLLFTPPPPPPVDRLMVRTMLAATPFVLFKGGEDMIVLNHRTFPIGVVADSLIAANLTTVKPITSVQSRDVQLIRELTQNVVPFGPIPQALPQYEQKYNTGYYHYMAKNYPKLFHFVMPLDGQNPGNVPSVERRFDGPSSALPPRLIPDGVATLSNRRSRQSRRFRVSTLGTIGYGPMDIF